SSLRWSPDGTRLAFVSDRGDHNFIGLYDFTAKSLRFLDPSTDTDIEPAWSSDSKRVAFMRIPAGVGGLPFTPQRSAQPWSIRVADVTSGTGRHRAPPSVARPARRRGRSGADQGNAARVVAGADERRQTRLSSCRWETAAASGHRGLGRPRHTRPRAGRHPGGLSDCRIGGT